MNQSISAGPHGGPLAWMVRNPVAANLIMALILVGGFLMAARVKKEVFPEFKLDLVVVAVAYPGAGPAEVESGIVAAVEEAVRGVDGIERVTATAGEGRASIFAEVALGRDADAILSDVKNAVDRITSIPAEAERPVVTLATNRAEVIALVVHGDQTLGLLRKVAEDVREDLLSDPGITHAEIFGAPPREISIEVPSAQLRTYGLTLEEIARKVAQTSVELPGGSVQTVGGEVLLRTAERRRRAVEFADVPVVSSPGGSEIRLEDVATISDAFAETHESATYDGEAAVMIKVFRTGDQSPVEVADAVKARAALLREHLPPGVALSQWLDWSQLYRERMDLMLRNAYLGLALVMITLGLLLELRLAFWVTLGIPVSFLGAIMWMPAFDVSVNILSMFAFIITLGMVVDDAIVIGENIYEHRMRGHSAVASAIAGVREIAMPVVFMIATTVAAFMPMLFVPGVMGKFFRVIPIVVIAVLTISLLESLFVLPAHLAGLDDPRPGGILAWIRRHQQRLADGLDRFIRLRYGPLLDRALRRRYLSAAIGAVLVVLTVGWVAGGRMPFRFMPDIDGDLIWSGVELPFGTPLARTEDLRREMVESAEQVASELGDRSAVRGIFAQIGASRPPDPSQIDRRAPGGHLANVQVLLVPAERRSFPAREFMNRWRERVGEIPEAKAVTWSAEIGPGQDKPIDVEIAHPDPATLDRAAGELADALAGYGGVLDVDDGIDIGKSQLDIRVTSTATSLGLTAAEVARQIRSAFYGAEALRQQDGRDEVKVLVRLPERERRSLQDFEELLIRLPGGGELPLREAADVIHSRSVPSIRHADGHRVLHVTADVDDATTPGSLITALEADVLPDLAHRHPGLHAEFAGENREQRKALGALQVGGLLSMLAIFAMLAIPFRSYIQPAIVMAAIPFGLVGAIGGHALMGLELSMVTMLGIIAMAGVVVNDSLVLVDAANVFRRDEGLDPLSAVHAAGVRRFRPILLTSITTFFGLAPLIFETSMQARFLIPMAVALGFGVMFSTVTTLLVVPAIYMIVEDLRSARKPRAPAGSVEPGA